jgi:ADP-L-glycero-D-manno-heptose 6-epimerase
MIHFFRAFQAGLPGRTAPVQRPSGAHCCTLLKVLHLVTVWGKPGPDGVNLKRYAASMLLVTGGAGFIGSNLVASLNEAGRTDIAVNDILGTGQKWRNLAKRRLAEFVPAGDLLPWLDGRKLEAVVHMGAISSTTETDVDLLMENNFRLSLRLFEWCAASRTPFIYASSAATYGDGDAGFADDYSSAGLARLRPLNPYGWSKHLFDQAVIERVARKDKVPPQWAGLKFFNVFGPNEYHKGEMMSLVAKRFDDAKAGAPIRLFKSHRSGIGDGEQKRDFIHVDDAVAVVRWLLETPSVSGIFNVGTAKARSFRDLMSAMFAALGQEPNIEYVDMPDAIRGSYQYFTQAKMDNVRQAGFAADFLTLEEGVKRYVSGYLDRADRFR